MNQVLDEIGIEVKGKMDSAPAAGSSSLAGKSLQSFVKGDKICYMQILVCEPQLCI